MSICVCLFEVCTAVTGWNGTVLLADCDANLNHAQNKCLKSSSVI